MRLPVLQGDTARVTVFWWMCISCLEKDGVLTILYDIYLIYPTPQFMICLLLQVTLVPGEPSNYTIDAEQVQQLTLAHDSLKYSFFVVNVNSYEFIAS